MSRRRLLVIILVLLVAAVFTVGRRLYRRVSLPSVSQERFRHIKQGMQRVEVEAIIGGPPGDYKTEDRVLVGMFALPPGDIWEGDEGLLIVHYDEEEQTDSADFIEADQYSIPAERPSLFRRIGEWLGL